MGIPEVVIDLEVCHNSLVEERCVQSAERNLTRIYFIVQQTTDYAIYAIVGVISPRCVEQRDVDEMTEMNDGVDLVLAKLLGVIKILVHVIVWYSIR